MGGSSMYFIDALSSLAKLGHFGFNRQSLVGGNYELLSTDSLEPNPDFWVAVLFSRLMGTRVLDTSMVEGSDLDLHIFAHCGREPGTVAFAFANRDTRRSFEVRLDVAGVNSTTSMRSEYHLTAANSSDRFDRFALLNGRSLTLPGYAELPSLAPKERPNSELMKIDPFSVGFATLKDVYPSFCEEVRIV